MTNRPRLLIEDWLPAAAIGVECIRERSTGQQPPDKRLHVWWARRPLVASRAAVLGSLLPADFPRDVFERLLGFWGSSQDIVLAQQALDWAKTMGGPRVRNPHGDRAFKRGLREDDLRKAHQAAAVLWHDGVSVLDPMAGGGSIPLEAARLGFRSFANEYNPVACSVLEATVDYPIRYGPRLAAATRKWGAELRKGFNARMERFYPKTGYLPPHCYIFARTVPCPDTQHPTPLVPDWHLLKAKSGRRVAAEPVVDANKGTWHVRIREVGRGAGQLHEPPRPTYAKGKGVSLFTGRPIPADYIKAKAQAGEMGSALYAVALKTSQGLTFQPPEPADVVALEEAETQLAQLRPLWERSNVIPTEDRTKGDCDRSFVYGVTKWADMFSPRQLLCLGVLVEELREMRSEIVEAEGEELGEAVIHMLALGLDKFANWNAILSSWNAPAQTARSVFDRHDFSFKATFCEMAPCNAGSGLDWALDNVLDAYGNGAQLACYSGEGGQVWDGSEWKSVSKDRITAALAEGELRFVLCTDAASEGLNLQAASALVNYDLPWNPGKVEQRIGRIDRIGQRFDEVRVVNLFLKDSVDDRVYAVLRARCGLFEHFVGPMQPVLARARRMLLGRDDPSTDVLETAARGVEEEPLATESYVESEPESLDPSDAPVTRANLLEELSRLKGDVGPGAKRGRDGLWKITGVKGVGGRWAADAAGLEADPSALPLSPLTPELRKLADALWHPGERLPLVVAAHRSGAFRATAAYWVAGGEVDQVKTLAGLRRRLEAWTGEYPDPREWRDAEELARREAEKAVRAMDRRAHERVAANLRRQTEAASLRLQRELGRYLVCLDAGNPDLNAVLYQQMSRDIASAARLNKAREHLGGHPEWSAEIRRELLEFCETLTANQRRARLLGSEIDAALADPRWMVDG